MMKRRDFLRVSAGGLIAAPFISTRAWAAYPDKQIHWIVPYPPGGTTDILARLVAQFLSDRLGQQFVIENRAGGGNNIGTDAVVRAAPDGYTVLLVNPANGINTSLYKKLPFDPENSLVPITNAFHLIHVLVVNSDLHVKNVDELCALSKAKPGTLNYLSPGAPMVLYMETLKKEKGCDWVRVPFRGGGEAVNAILSGTTPIGLFGEGNLIGNIRAGQMTPLVMMNNIRSPNFPQVPLLTEVGYNGPPSRSWYGIFAPAGTAKSVVDRVSKDIGEVINRPEFRDRHLTARSLVGAANTPEQFAEDIKRERVVAEKVVKDAGFEPQ